LHFFEDSYVQNFNALSLTGAALGIFKIGQLVAEKLHIVCWGILF